MSSSDDDDEQVLMHARVTRRKLGVSRQPPLAQAKADVQVRVQRRRLKGAGGGQLADARAAAWQTAAKYVRNDAQRNRGSFCIGAFTGARGPARAGGRRPLTHATHCRQSFWW